jgi:hypothetical protein
VRDHSSRKISLTNEKKKTTIVRKNEVSRSASYAVKKTIGFGDKKDRAAP